MSKLVNEVFDDVIVFSVSEPGAMGPNNMTFYTKAGEYFSVEYTDSNTYTELKDAEFAGSRLDDIASAYFVQKERDEMITNKIKELNKIPEYREKIACSENNDDMMEVLKEYGIEIDSFELTQIAFRQSGLF